MSTLEGKSSLTMAVLGCGNMGHAILTGLLSSQLKVSSVPMDLSAHPFPTISRFIASVKHHKSVQLAQSRLAHLTKVEGCPTVEVWQEQRNLEAIQLADIVLLSCQSPQVAGILSGSGVRAALSGKLLLSVCLGITTPRIRSLLDLGSMQLPCAIIYAMPNAASAIQQSSTIICSYASDPELSPTISGLVNYIFSSIGAFTKVPEPLMSAATVTAASSPAYFALALEGVIQGSMAEGISREKATIMAAQAMKGTAEMVLGGEDPNGVMRKVMTPNGCSEKGVHVLRDEGVCRAYAQSIRVSSTWAKDLEMAGVENEKAGL